MWLTKGIYTISDKALAKNEEFLFKVFFFSCITTNSWSNESYLFFSLRDDLIFDLSQIVGDYIFL